MFPMRAGRSLILNEYIQLKRFSVSNYFERFICSKGTLTTWRTTTKFFFDVFYYIWDMNEVIKYLIYCVRLLYFQSLYWAWSRLIEWKSSTLLLGAFLCCISFHTWDMRHDTLIFRHLHIAKYYERTVQWCYWKAMKEKRTIFIFIRRKFVDELAYQCFHWCSRMREHSRKKKKNISACFTAANQTNNYNCSSGSSFIKSMHTENTLYELLWSIFGKDFM